MIGSLFKRVLVVEGVCWFKCLLVSLGFGLVVGFRGLEIVLVKVLVLSVLEVFFRYGLCFISFFGF